MFQPEYEKRLLGQCLSGPSFPDERLIPQRAGNTWSRNFALNEKVDPKRGNCRRAAAQEDKRNTLYACLLRNEFLGSEIASLDACKTNDKYRCDVGDYKERENTRLYTYRQPREPSHQPFAAVNLASQRLLSMPIRPTRKLSRLPYKILDAPELQDDFYLNLIDWSSTNMLGVGLGCSVYLWSANNGQVTRLCDLSNEDNPVTGVSWHESGRKLALGTFSGYVSIWDASRQKLITKFEGHSARVGCLAWNCNCLASGSRDGTILVRDTRASPSTQAVRSMKGHTQEVCGLGWSLGGQYLASGGNDRRVLIWSNQSNDPLHRFEKHKAAVKALSWSPHKRGLLATGGGTSDRCLRFWNAHTGQLVQCIDSGSQISNLAWAPESQELVTTHGVGQPQLIVWRYPSLKQVVRLSGHSHRVVYLAVSPDGESIVTGAGDETLRFWSVFTKRQPQKAGDSVLALNYDMR
ncbi:fizzy-related protein homolog [Scaptodrosophila lebanonensis]|uniref:Fizzy-related protein homolog n=1 Tax=Drosophila lebanonensis TaxID=7225 RepID=A0A6J2UFT6_DROLE|nr:fizzy-related protein homolog [Scaptodrosophila lebanonensis]